MAHTKDSQDVPAVPVQYTLPQLVGRPLDPDWPTGVAAQHIVLSHFGDMLSWRRGVLDIGGEVPGAGGIEAVHKIRVATRRTRTALRTFARLWEPKAVRRFRRELSDFAQAFNDSRDLDVMSEYLRASLVQADAEHKAIFQSALDKTILLRKQEQGVLAKAISGLDASGFTGEFIEQFSGKPFDLRSWGGANG